MNRTELIQTLAANLGIPESESKLFFEMLLVRSSEVLEERNLPVAGLGRFELLKRDDDESDPGKIAFITEDKEELIFDIPRLEEENVPIDSYFSLSLGKPVIPHPGSEEDEFFIPRTRNEVKRLLELKVEKFIDDISKTEEDYSANDIAGIQFSFQNWKKASLFNKDIEENIKNLEDEIDSGIERNEEEVTDQKKDEALKVVEKTETGDLSSTEAEPEIRIEEELKTESGKSDDIEESVLLPESSESGSDLKEKVEDNFITKEKTETEQKPVYKKEAIFPGTPVGKEKPEELKARISAEVPTDKKVITQTLRNEKVSTEGYRKRSYKSLVFALIGIVITAGVIYLTYYLSGKEKAVSTEQQLPQKDFKVVVDRSFDIPVTYPYKSGMFKDAYNALKEDILNKPQQAEVKPSETGLSEIIIRKPQNAARIKGYIYKYDDGTYAVQVSSWKSKSIALSETQKYINAGLNAFIEQTEISSGTYYRVRIGGFKSVSEVEDFLNK